MECTPAIPNIQERSYNVTVIATPPPVEPELITVSAIYFAPSEGKFDSSIKHNYLTIPLMFQIAPGQST
jgi:hypothetical protein